MAVRQARAAATESLAIMAEEMTMSFVDLIRNNILTIVIGAAGAGAIGAGAIYLQPGETVTVEAPISSPGSSLAPSSAPSSIPNVFWVTTDLVKFKCDLSKYDNKYCRHSTERHPDFLLIQRHAGDASKVMINGTGIDETKLSGVTWDQLRKGVTFENRERKMLTLRAEASPPQ